jgi:bifunctional non-homologous end joining protein LigD
MLDKIKTKLPVDKVPGKSLVMTGPMYVAEIEYRAWIRRYGFPMLLV